MKIPILHQHIFLLAALPKCLRWVTIFQALTKTLHIPLLIVHSIIVCLCFWMDNYVTCCVKPFHSRKTVVLQVLCCLWQGTSFGQKKCQLSHQIRTLRVSRSHHALWLQDMVFAHWHLAKDGPPRVHQRWLMPWQTREKLVDKCKGMDQLSYEGPSQTGTRPVLVAWALPWLCHFVFQMTNDVFHMMVISSAS